VLTTLTSHGLAAGRRPAACPLRTGPRSGSPVGIHGCCAAGWLSCSPVWDELSTEWAATAELTPCYYDRHAAAATTTGHEDPDLDCHVSTDVETALRRSDPLPHTAPAVNDIGRLQQLIHATTDRQEEPIAEHIQPAENATTRHRATRHSRPPHRPNKPPSQHSPGRGRTPSPRRTGPGHSPAGPGSWAS